MIHPFYLAHERQRLMRPDAHRFLRPDWRHYVTPGSQLAAHYESIERKYRPDQPRYYVPRAVYEKMPLSLDARKVFEEATTGRLHDPRSNQFDKEHRMYNDAVGKALRNFMSEKQIKPEQMTQGQAEEFLGRVFETSDPVIRNLNMRYQIREIMHRVFRRMRIRGTE